MRKPSDVRDEDQRRASGWILPTRFDVTSHELLATTGTQSTLKAACHAKKHAMQTWYSCRPCVSVATSELAGALAIVPLAGKQRGIVRAGL